MAARLARFTETWSLDSGSERAQTTVWWLSPSGGLISDLADFLGSTTDTRWEVQRLLHPTSCSWLRGRLDEVRVSDGRVLTGVDTVQVTNPQGAGSSTTLPQECAEVLTLRSPFSTARARGRIYLPAMSVSQLNVNGRIQHTPRNTVVDAYQEWFDGTRSLSSDSWHGVIYSRTDRAANTISAIDMGDVFDVMRSRRRSLVEDRYRVAIAT